MKHANLSESISEKQRSLEALLDFVSQINSMDSIEDVIWHVAYHTIKDLNFEDCVIYLLDKDQKTLMQVAAFGNKSPKRMQILHPISIRVGEGIVGKSAVTQSTILIPDTRLEPSYIIDDKARLSELTVPIIYKGRLFGVIDSEHSEVNFFTADHQKYLEILASVLAAKLSFQSNTITLKNTIEALEKSNKLAEIYLAISSLTYSSNSEKELYSKLHLIISTQIKAGSFFVVLFDKRTCLYSFAYQKNEQKAAQYNISPDQDKIKLSLVGKAIQSQTSCLAHSKELQRISAKAQLIIQDRVPFCCLVVPFEIDDKLTGAIALQSFDESVSFTHQDESILNFLGQHISTAIERKFKDQKLLHQAQHDQITGLANRALFLEKIDHAFSKSRRSVDIDMAVLFIDFDDFKQINDNFGHQTGDKLLFTAARRMQSQLRESDTLARLGGDEFAIILEALETPHQAILIAERILKTLQKPEIIDGRSVEITISIGVAFKDQNTHSAEDLLRNADHAMYHAKNQGKNAIQIYESELHQALENERKLHADLVEAIEQKQFIFYYQPIVNLKNNQIMGFEALLRWQHPERGLILPDEFIQVAEQSNLIKLIDAQMLIFVAQQLQKWQPIYPHPIYVSINISAQRFVDSNLFEELKQVIQQYQIKPHSIVIELTEHVLIENLGKTCQLFHQLKSLGLRISLNDFGTGYSSLSYLNQLPFDILKIDRSFISNITANNPDQPIVKTIIALANTLKIDLIAEGIETQLQLETIAKMKCRFGQGFHFSKPVAPDIAEKLLLAGKIMIID